MNRPVKSKTVYTIRVTEGTYPYHFRDVDFTTKEEAVAFRALALEDGTYWGETEKEVLTEDE